MAKLTVFDMTAAGRGFASRGKGRIVFDQLQNRLADQPGASPELIVDWSGVNAASPGFIDEFIGLLCPEGDSDARCKGIVFAGSKPYTTNLIHTILSRRGREMRYAPTVADALAGRAFEVLGKGVMRAG